MSEPYRFCYTCGGLLEAIERIWSYDGNTGAPNIVYDYRCPNKGRFTLGHPLTSGEAYAMQAG